MYLVKEYKVEEIMENVFHFSKMENIFLTFEVAFSNNKKHFSRLIHFL